MKKEKRLQVKKGSRLKLKNGKFARVEEKPKMNDMTVLVKVYEEVNNIRVIPLGQISEVVRY